MRCFGPAVDSTNRKNLPQGQAERKTMTEKKDRIADSVSRLIKHALTPKTRTGSIMGKLADQFAKAKSVRRDARDFRREKK